jgi:hypothetical protein
LPDESSNSLARDWATIWQSELAAIAADSETGLVIESLCAAWLEAAAALDVGQVDPEPAARPDAAAGAAAAGAAAGARDAAVDPIRRRLAALEQRARRSDSGIP